MALTKPKLSQNIDTDISVFSDPILVLHQGSTSANLDVGFLMNRSNGLTSNAAVIWQESTKSFVYILTNDSGAANSNLNVLSFANVTVGNITSNVLYTYEGIRWAGNGNVFASGGGGGGVFTASNTAPVGANESDFWYKISEDILLQYITDGTSSYWVDVQSQTLFANTPNTTGTFNFLGETTITGNLIPTANITYNLGSEQYQWKELWVSNNTIYIGNTPIRVHNGTLLVNNAPVTGSGAGITFTANTVPPTTGNISGDKWYNTVTDVLYEYIDCGPTSYWVDVQSQTLAANASNIGLSGNSSTQFGANLGAYQTYANANVVAIQANLGAYQTYANANVVAIQANLGAYQTYANTQASQMYLPSVSRLSVTNSGPSAYLFDQYSGNNPTIYVSGGETISFNLSVSGHPFMIRVSSGGSNYSTGLTHVATNGTVSTDSSAQGQVAGTLYWKVPFDLVGSTYVYQCSVHGGMVGSIVILPPATFVSANLSAFQTYANTKIGTNGNSNLVVVATTTSTSTSTGALVVGGGAGIAGNVTADRFTTTTGLFWDNGAAFSSGLSSAQVNASIWAQKIFWG